LKKLRRELAQARRPLVVCAIGGMGKTTLAQMYWRQHKSAYDHVAWLSAVAVFSGEEGRGAENAEYFLRAFTDSVELKTNLTLTFDPQERPVEHFRRVVAALANVQGRNLLVVDNAPEAATIYADELSKLSENWRILLTSRHAIPNMEAFELEALPPDEAARVFWNIYASEALTGSHPLTAAAAPELDTLLRAIGYHTLTIELLAAYAREKNLDPAGLRREVEARGLAQLDGYNITVKKWGKNQPLHAHLRDTFLLDLSEAEKELMRYFCVLPPDGTALDAELQSEDFLCQLFEKQADKLEFHNLLRDLVRLHWLVARGAAYACHPVIADTAKAQLLPDAESCAVLIKNVTGLLTPDEDTNEPVIARARFAPLGEAVFKGVWKEKGDFVEADGAVATLAFRLDWLFRDWGELFKALDYSQKMVAIWEKVLPAEHPHLATAYNNLAATYGDLGEHQKRLEFNLKALTIWGKVLPAEHPHLATAYNNLAATYGDLGEYQKSLEYNQKALAIREKVLPAEHPHLASSYNNLAATYNDLGEHQKSLEYNQKALAIWEKVLPAEHPHLAQSYNNLALTYGALGEHPKSLEYNQKALAIWEKVLPAEHPDLALSYNNLAWTWHELGDLDKACDYMRRAVAIREKALPAEHPHLLQSKKNLTIFEEKRQARRGK
jgi:tetratricopeptide (TPR) repeat protein